MLLKTGDIFPDFLFDTPSVCEQRFYNVIKNQPTTLIFLRDSGCAITRYFIEELRESLRLFLSERRNLVVVVEGKPQDFAEYKKLTFPLICDAESALYRALQLPKAPGKFSLLSLKALTIIQKAKNEGLDYETSIKKNMQLPVTILLERDRSIESINLGKSITDIPTMLELLGGGGPEYDFEEFEEIDIAKNA